MSSSSALYQLFLDSRGVCTDTRSLEQGQLFFALKGANFDGNAFAGEAIERGALAAIVDDPDQRSASDKYIQVPDVLKTLQSLANYHRRRFDIPIIGLTGSNGKTTTKEILHRVLGRKYRVHCTEGNFNNLIGLPLTLLGMPVDTEVAVLEMGSNAPGEISQLVQIAQPTHGLVTNVGLAHIEGLNDLEGVKKEKGALYRYLAARDGLAFVDLDENELQSMASSVRRKVFYFGSGQLNGEKEGTGVEMLQEVPFIRYAFKVEGRRFEGNSPLFGKHNFRNICSGVAAGVHFGLSGEQITDGIAEYVPANNRSQILHIGSNKVILDAYNANPNSVHSAIELLDNWPGNNKKMIVLGDMLELGKRAAMEHKRVVEKLCELDFDRVYLVGETYSDFDQSFFPAFPGVEELKPLLDWKAMDDWLVLIKGSRAIQLEKLVDQL